jgi:hypothetical protein
VREKQDGKARRRVGPERRFAVRKHVRYRPVRGQLVIGTRFEALVGWQITTTYVNDAPANVPKSCRLFGASTVTIGVFDGSARRSIGLREQCRWRGHAFPIRLRLSPGASRLKSCATLLHSTGYGRASDRGGTDDGANASRAPSDANRRRSERQAGYASRAQIVVAIVLAPTSIALRLCAPISRNMIRL